MTQKTLKFGAALALAITLASCGQKGGDGGLSQSSQVPKNFVPGVRLGRSMLHTVARAGSQSLAEGNISNFRRSFEGLLPATGGQAVITDHVKIGLDFSLRVGRNAADNVNNARAVVFPGVNLDQAPKNATTGNLNFTDAQLVRVTQNIYTRTHGMTPTPELQTAMVDAAKEFLTSVSGPNSDAGNTTEATRRAFASLFAMIALPMLVN